MSTTNCPQSSIRIRKNLNLCQQQHKQSKSGCIWGWIKFHDNFNDLIDEPIIIEQRILKVYVRKNINYRNLLSAFKSLLNAPRGLIHGYSLFLNHNNPPENENFLFNGQFLNNISLQNGFQIDFIPSPVYYAQKLVSLYNKNKEDSNIARQIFSILNHPTFMFHLKNEFGFRQFILFLLNWLPQAGDSWPWNSWEFHRLFSWVKDSDWKEIDDFEESNELILSTTFDNIQNGQDGLFDFGLELLNWLLKKCTQICGKFLKTIDIKFISDILPRSNLLRYPNILSILVILHENADDERRVEIEKSLNQPVFVDFFAEVVLTNSKRNHFQLKKQLFKVQQIRFAEVRRFLNTSVGFEDAADLDRLIQEKCPNQTVDDIVEFISTSPPGWYLYEAIYLTINGEIDTQLLTLLDDGHLSIRDFIRMCKNVLNSVFKSISTSEKPFEPVYQPVLAYESNPIAWMYKNGCLLFQDIWFCKQMQRHENNLRFYETSKLVDEILCQLIESQPLTLNEWTTRLHNSFLVKWLCKKEEEWSDHQIEQTMQWETEIRETMMPKIKEIVRKKYVGYLQQGFLFKKYTKNPNSVETCLRKWMLDRSEIAFRVYEFDSKQKLKSDENEEDADLPELILGINSISRIIQGDEYLEKSKILFPTKKRIFRKDKAPKIPKGLFIETSSEEHEILYDDVDEFQKFITAFNILRFNQYPDSEVDKILDFEVKIRLLNLNNAEETDEDSDQEPLPPFPKLPII